MASMEKIGGWHICTDKIHYHANTASLLPIYPTLISTYRTLIFNGDVDGCVPYIGNEVKGILRLRSLIYLVTAYQFCVHSNGHLALGLR